MKKLYTISLGLAISLSGFSQSCLPEGITFHTQAQIDSFQVNFPGCTMIEGDVYIGDDSEESNISNLLSLSVLESVAGNMFILYNDSLTSLQGLENLISIGGDIDIFHNPALTDLEGLEGLTQVNYFIVSGNDGLTSLAGLEKLTTIGNGLTIHNNQSLLNLTGLEDLTSVGGGVGITNNNALVSLDGLNNLTTIGDGLIIEFNINLESIEALQNLTSIQNDDNWTTLSITANDVLTSLTGLDQIEPASINDLSISWNLALSDCDVNSICQYLANPSASVYIFYNAPGCNSQEEIESSCGVGFEEGGTFESLFSIYPNPSSGQLTIEAKIPINQGVIDIFSINSLKVYHCQITEPKMFVDVNYLPAGIYFVRFTCEDEVRMFKVVKY